MKSRIKNIVGPVGLLLTLFGSIFYGILYENGLVAILPLLAGVILSLTALTLDFRSHGTEGRTRSARYGLNTAVTILIVAALMIFAQTLSMRHNIRVDMTSNRRFSISRQTVQVLEDLEDDVDFTCFFRETAPEKIELQDLLAELRTISPRIAYRFVDPDKDPMTARRYELKDYGTIFIEVDGRSEPLNGFSEEKLTNAISRMLSPHGKKVYFSTGHGEKSIEDEEPAGYASLAEALRLENYEVEGFLPLGSEGIPEDCTLLILAGPEEDLLKPELNLIFDYLVRGGKVLLMVDPITDIPLISSIASAFGIVVGDDIVIDPNGNRLAGNYLTPVVNQYGTHPITKDFKLFSFFPQARSISVEARLPDAVTITVLGKTGETAYAEVSTDTLVSMGKTQYEPLEDGPGPVTISVAGEMELVLPPADSTAAGLPGRTRIVVFGDSDFCGNANFRLSGNRDLVLNAVNWLAEEEDLISIRPAEVLNQPVLLTSEQGRIVFWLPVIGLPALFALAGILVNIRNRRSP